ncbi:MAG: S8 family peptidase [Bacteroidales bacterium]|nr:S8 family peptidase [Bacteroidales bacterium]
MKKLFLMIAACLGTLFATAQTIAPSLTEEMAKRGDDEKIKISIMMQEQADATALLRTTNAFATNKERREYVVATLKRQAEAAQADLLSLLEEMQRNGMVADIRPLWIANAIGCEANKTAIEALGQRNDIQTVFFAENDWFPTNEQSHTLTSAERGITDNLLKVNADKVWELGYTGQGVLIGHLDTGANYNHNDLQGRMWDGGTEFPHHGYDVYDHDDDPMDYLGHGTHVAGTICGTGAAGTQTGVAPGATLMEVKVFADIDEAGNTTAIVEGMQFALEHGVQVINMSLGKAGSAEQTPEKSIIRQSCDNYLAAGVVVVATAGNDGAWEQLLPIPNNLSCPGSCPSPWPHPDQAGNAGGQSAVICVGAVEINDAHLVYSSNGPTHWDDVSEYGDYPYAAGSSTQYGLIKPDVCAPGANVTSLDYNNPSGYTANVGTSFAAPCVTGTIALMLSKDPDLTPAQIDEILQTTCVKLTEHKDNKLGSGRIDALAAVMAVGEDAVNESIGGTANVYPNPSTEGFTVVCEGMTEATVYSMDGKLMKRIVAEGQCNIEGLSEGVYLLKIDTMNGTLVQKIVKM